MGTVDRFPMMPMAYPMGTVDRFPVSRK